MKPLSVSSCRLALLLLVVCLSTLAECQSGLAGVLPEDKFKQLFPKPNKFYTYSALISASKAFPKFATTGSLDIRKREVAAFFGHVWQETARLTDIEEHMATRGPYCDKTNGYPCARGKSYYGRGPLQLSWNYNYRLASEVLKVDIWADPDRVARNPILAFKTALWFWMTPQPPKPACHNVIVSGRDFGVTINIINGFHECGKVSQAAENRIKYYKYFCKILDVKPGPSKGCR
uniref:Glycoside hydrolase family 19 catalytic domain-containing protein n=1 Tax=Physcomitrium patens TaxID=3218 RepID=A0A2K1J8Z6_PHYPA|nr:hypothetical protein PHYPA_021113 [Physcomitrium patens]